MKLRILFAGLVLALTLATARAEDPQVYFSRSDPVARILVREIDAAHQSIHLLIYSLTDDDLMNALVRAAARGVDVKIVMDKTQADGNSSLFDALVGKLGEKRVEIRSGKGRGVMHEKMAVYDGLTVTLGSFNWTDNARDNNWENLIVLRDARLAAACEREFQRVWTSPRPKEPKPDHASKPKPKKR
ncbi:MAG: DUF1669 domain-containing protein [Opitutae bacterium]|nr:DUF1669 domain-containing protein [Opitutae bacterium]